MHGKVGKETQCFDGVLHLGLEAGSMGPWGWIGRTHQNIATAAVYLCTAFFLNAMKEIYNKDASPSIHFKKKILLYL